MPLQLTPDYVVGFTDAEGSFTIAVEPKSTFQTGYQIFLLFSIAQSTDRGKQLLEAIKQFFKCGDVVPSHQKGSQVSNTNYKRSSDHYHYQVYGIRDIMVKIIPFFDNHHLILNKRATTYGEKQPKE